METRMQYRARGMGLRVLSHCNEGYPDGTGRALVDRCGPSLDRGWSAGECIANTRAESIISGQPV